MLTPPPDGIYWLKIRPGARMGDDPAVLREAEWQVVEVTRDGEGSLRPAATKLLFIGCELWFDWADPDEFEGEVVAVGPRLDPPGD